jgi:gliding motility-associated-like protein
MKKQRLLLLCITFLLLHTLTLAQKDTSFWFAAPEISASAGDNPIYLRFLSYDVPATVVVSQPANGAFVPVSISLPAHAVDSINLTPFLAGIESPAADVVANNGLRISSTSPISAYYEVKATAGKEIFSLKGSKALGMNFYTPFQKFWNNGVTTPASFSSIDVVATQNNTTILVTPRTAVTGHVANVSFSVVLNAGETYSARDMNVTAVTSLAGSIVSSDKPVSVTVFSGALSHLGCLSPVGDQLTSTAYIGNDHIIHTGNTADRVYILATQNGTNITIHNSTTTTSLINSGETYSYTLSDTVNYIQTSKPVYIWHMSGYGCSLAGAQVPPVFCAGTYSTSFTRSTSDSLGLLLYTRTGFENQFAINGNASLIPAAAFKTVPGTSGTYKVALIYYSTAQIPLNTYNEVTNTGDIFGMATLNGRRTKGSSYAYFSEFSSYPFVRAGADDTICANVPFAISGTVGGGSVTGYWSGTGFGSFQNSTTQLNNAYIPSPLDTLIGPIKLILTSTGPCLARKDTLILHVTPSPIVNASADQTVCFNAANVQLAGTISGGASTGVWTTLGSGTFVPNDTVPNAVYQPSNADLTAGTVKLVLTSTHQGSCNAVTDTMKVTITPPPFVNAGPDTIYACSNNALVHLNGSVSGATATGKWTTAGNGLFSPNNLALNATYQASPGDVAAGSVMLYLESTGNGNCLAVKDSVRIVFTISPFANAGANLIACTNDPEVQLHGVVSGFTSTGEWSGGQGTFSPNTTNLNARYTPTPAEISNGSMVLTLTSTNNIGCISVSSNVQINFVAPPFANFNFTDECLKTGIDFTDFSLPGYGTITGWRWNFDDGNLSTAQNNTHLYTAPGIYDVRLITTTNVGCSDTVIKPVRVFAPPVSDFSYVVKCIGTQVIIDFTDMSTSAVGAINSWFYDFGGQGSIASPNPSQLFTGSGNFVITHIVRTVHGCADTLIQTITVPEKPKAGFYYNTTNGLNIGAVFNFIDTSANASGYSWTFGDGHTSTLQDPSNTYFSNGNFVVTQYVYGALGCVDSVSVLLTINTVTNEINNLIPNAISPNGDGKNDVWKLNFIQLMYPNATVEVYNQWGQQIFQSTGYTVPWNALYQGERVSDGTYYYIINLNNGGDSDLYKGTVLVLKNGN